MFVVAGMFVSVFAVKPVAGSSTTMCTRSIAVPCGSVTRGQAGSAGLRERAPGKAASIAATKTRRSVRQANAIA